MTGGHSADDLTLFQVPGASIHPPLVEVRGTIFRCADYDTPLWIRPNSQSGRWHVADGKTSVQYWAFSAAGAWAERLRAEGIMDPEDLQLMRSRIWVGAVVCSEVADLTDDTWLAWLGVGRDDLIADDWSKCQAAVAEIRQRGARGAITHSAALPDHLNLVLYGRRVRGDWHEHPENNPLPLRFSDTLPVQLAATGYPEPDLLHRVRYRSVAPIT